jgi:hypothetical protein
MVTFSSDVSKTLNVRRRVFRCRRCSEDRDVPVNGVCDVYCYDVDFIAKSRHSTEDKTVASRRGIHKMGILHMRKPVSL